MILNPDIMHITHHARERYLERRGGKPPTADNLEMAGIAIRDMLWRVAHQLPDQSNRVYVGEIGFVISPDLQTVITVVTSRQDARSKKKRSKAKHASRRPQGRAA